MSITKKPVQCSICYEVISQEECENMILCPFCSRGFHFLCIEEQLLCDACDERVLWPKTGSEEYLELLQCLDPTFPSGDSLFLNVEGDRLHSCFFDQNGFETPIKVRNTRGLGLQVPPSDFSVDDVVRCCGPELNVDVINVKQQADQQMTLQQFGDYFKNKDDSDDIFNLISLEFSETQLTYMVKPPSVVNELSWVSTTCHAEIKEALLDNMDLTETEFYPFGQPQVLRYCLISAKNSFTDFHIDFGGTSVWYHLLWGKKVFYMIEPTEKNLKAYENWMKKDHRDRTHSCFVENVDRCYRCEFSPGETIFIPAGWIHGVYTPEDSLVFGGNFLHYYGVATSLKVFELEKRLNIADRFTFPDYELVNFMAAKNLCGMIDSWRIVGKVPSPYHLRAIKELLPRLKRWHEENPKLRQDLRSAEDPINYKKLIQMLQRIVKKSNSVKDLMSMKINFSLNGDDCGDEDANFYCRPKVKIGKAKVKQENNEVKCETDEQIKVNVDAMSDSDNSDQLNEEEIGKIDLKLKAKLIHTLPVQKKKKSSPKVSTAVAKKRKIKEEKSSSSSKEHCSGGTSQESESELVKASSSLRKALDSSEHEEDDGSSKVIGSNSISCSQSSDSLSLKSSQPKRPRKGCATPKQRLGKILNIKMR